MKTKSWLKERVEAPGGPTFEAGTEVTVIAPETETSIISVQETIDPNTVKVSAFVVASSKVATGAVP